MLWELREHRPKAQPETMILRYEESPLCVKRLPLFALPLFFSSLSANKHPSQQHTKQTHTHTRHSHRFTNFRALHPVVVRRTDQPPTYAKLSSLCKQALSLFFFVFLFRPPFVDGSTKGTEQRRETQLTRDPHTHTAEYSSSSSSSSIASAFWHSTTKGKKHTVFLGV